MLLISYCKLKSEVSHMYCSSDAYWCILIDNNEKPKEKKIIVFKWN